MLLVRVLNRNTAKTAANLPQIVELPNSAEPKKYSPIRRLIIPCDSVAPDFKVLLFAYRNGEALPQTAWDNQRGTVSVSIGAQKDSIAFAPSPGGKSAVKIVRGGKTLLEVTTDAAPLK